jgi:hypothetical protein
MWSWLLGFCSFPCSRLTPNPQYKIAGVPGPDSVPRALVGRLSAAAVKSKGPPGAVVQFLRIWGRERGPPAGWRTHLTEAQSRTCHRRCQPPHPPSLRVPPADAPRLHRAPRADGARRTLPGAPLPPHHRGTTAPGYPPRNTELELLEGSAPPGARPAAMARPQTPQ